MVNLSDKAKRLLKQAGEGSVWGSENSTLEVIPFSSPMLNTLSGIGGVPRGRVVLFAGQPSAGKTLIALDLAKNVEKNGGSFLYFDGEYAYTPEWGEALGIQADPSEWCIRENNAKKIWEVLIGRPETYGKAQEDRGILNSEEWIKEDKLQLVIIDSLDSLVPPAQENSEIGKQNMALMPRFLSAELPRLVEAAARANVAIVFVLQVRTDLGTMYGNPETVSGGKAIRHAASIFYNVHRRRGKDYPTIEEDGTIMGHTVGCRIDKNKVGPPHREGDFMVHYGMGLCNFEKELVALAIQHGLVTRPTSKKWSLKTSDGNEIEVVGEKQFKEQVSSSPEILEDIRQQLQEKGVKI